MFVPLLNDLKVSSRPSVYEAQAAFNRANPKYSKHPSSHRSS